MNVITLKPHRYKNKQKFPGDKYDFKGRAERRLAIALGWVKRTYDDNVVEVQEVVKEDVKFDFVAGQDFVANIETADEVEQDEVIVPADDSNVVVDVIYKPRRTYKRRDMVSDE